MVGIRGDLDSLQTSIDFYLSITSKDAVLDSRTMRDRFFKMFQDEDKYREENFLVYQEKVSDDYKVNHDVEPILMGEEAVFEEGVCYFEEDVEEVDYGEEVEDDEVGNTEVEEDEEDDFVSEDYEEVNDEFTNWGNSDEEEIEDTEEEVDDDFVNWGNDEEDEVIDEVESDEEDDFVNWGNEEGSEDDFENWGNDSEGEDEVVEEDEDAYSGWGSEEEEIIEEDDIAVEEEVFTGWGNDGTEEVESTEKVEELDDLDFGMFDTSFDFEEEVVQPKNKVEKVEVKETKDTITEVPKDLREFIKMYPNCEISVALKYFSKKEIDKQLSLGRVFKRKNKLMI